MSKGFQSLGGSASSASGARNRFEPVHPGLSFVRFEITPRGRLVTLHGFDMRVFDHPAPAVRGLMAARELVSYLRTCPDDGKLLVARDAMRAASACADFRTKGAAREVALAAWQFLNQMSLFLVGGCCWAADPAGMIEPRIAHEEQSAQRWRAYQAAKGAEFAARMRQARERKRAGLQAPRRAARPAAASTGASQ